MNRLLFFAFSVFFTGCSIKENIIDTQTGELIAGYSQKCKYVIGRTNRSDISDDQLKRDGLGFDFSYHPVNGWQKGYLLAAGGEGKFATSKGVKKGDSAKKAEKIYGSPRAKVLDYGKSESVHYIYYGLFYKNLTIFTDTTCTEVIGFTVGKKFDLSKKYIKMK